MTISSGPGQFFSCMGLSMGSFNFLWFVKTFYYRVGSIAESVVCQLSFKVVMWWGGVAGRVREGCRSTLPLWEFCLLVHSEQNWGVRKPTLNFSFVTSHENPNFYAAIFYLLCLWATHNEFTNHLENFCAYSCFMELNTLAELMLRAGHSGKRQVEYF